LTSNSGYQNRKVRAAKWGQQVGAAKILRYQDDEVRDGVDAEGDGRLIASTCCSKVEHQRKFDLRR
jgi:hypothetical protein